NVDRLSIIGLRPWAEAGNERLNSILRQRQLFDDRQVLIDLRLSEFARSLRMPEPEGHVQDNYCSGKNELNHIVVPFLNLCGSAEINHAAKPVTHQTKMLSLDSL